MAPLESLRVVDLSRVLAGPYCAQLLADQGADVIKVESPEGDENRLWGTRAQNGLTCNFNSVNRGKRSLTLNLKSRAARGVLHRLVEQADIVIHSFLPDTGLRLGIDYETIKVIKPDIIFCSITGYGEKGPLRNRPGYDLMMQAFSGIMSTTGTEGEPPVRVGASVIDLTTGALAYGAILTALINRSRGNGGSWVRLSLLETAISLLGYHAVAWLQAGLLPRKEGSGVVHLVPYQAFQCRDGYLLAGATNDAAWRRFAAALGRSDFASDERFLTNDQRVANRDTLVPLLQQVFGGQSVDHWISRFDEHGVAAAPINTLDQILTHPQVLANDMVIKAKTADGREMSLLGAPFKLSDVAGTATRGVPQLGADTEEILKELNLDGAQIAQLRVEGAI